jgi:hypothetical protein
VGKDYASLVQAYIDATPSVYQMEAEYQPKFTQLALQNRAATVGQVGGLSPGVMQTMRAYNPAMTGLLDQLGQAAAEQMRMNGGLDPFMRRSLQQNVRGAQAARGFGWSPGDAAQEAYYLQSTQEARRMGDQQFAGNVAAQQQQYYQDPFVRVAGMPPVAAGSQVLPGSQSYDMFNTAYNARSAAQIATANNQAAADNSY